MKIALVHDFLKEYGGAERVLEALHEIWPKAPVYTSFVDWQGLGPHAQRLKCWQIKTSWAQKIPFFSKLYSPLRFLAPKFFESFDFSEYDMVVSSCNAYYAKGILTKPPTIHICYCHTPPRSLYGYATRMDWQKNPLINIYGQVVNHFLRVYDFKISQKVDYFVANSKVVQQRIAKFYRRNSTVIYPPVGGLSLREGSVATDEAILKSNGKRLPRPFGARNDRLEDKYFLYIGKLAVAKNVNLAIEAALNLGFKLKIVGKGSSSSVIPRSEATRNLLRRQGLTETMGSTSSPQGSEIPHGVYPERSRRSRNDEGGEVEFLGEISDQDLANLYANCQAVIFPAVDEDFGIVPVEAMSFGKPVIALRSGGVVETVIDGVTGIFFNNPTAESLAQAIKKLEKIKIRPEDCQKQAEKFSKERFKEELTKFVRDKLWIKE